MAKKSRRRKPEVKRPLETPAGRTLDTHRVIYKPWQIAAVCVLLAVVTAFCYQGVRGNQFLTYDDNYYVLENRNVQHGLNPQSIEWAFTTFTQANWHPLTWISHIVDWSLYGKNPAGHHITNVCLHIANAILLLLLLLYMTDYLGRSAMVAFLFALHPAHVESVAWIAERKDVLCTFFWLATLLAYVWNLRKPSWKRYAWVVIGFACALMSKPMAVTLPLTLLLLDYWPLRRISFAPEMREHWYSSLWKLCIEKWLLFLMTAGSCVVTYVAQKAGGAVGSLQILPLWVRFCNTAISYCRYVRIMFWPNPLRAYYYYDSDHIAVFAAILSAIALIVVTAVCWRFRKERPYCLAGWLWFLITLVPVIGIVQVGEQAMAERYTYVPFIGLFFAVVWLIGDAVAKSPKTKIAVQLLALAIIAACAVKTYAQVKVWKNTVTLFSHILAVDPRGELPNLSLGVAYVRLGNTAEALPYLERALVYRPNGPLSLAYSAYCLIQTHNPRNMQLAHQRLEEALRVDPDNPDALTDMALWSSLMGRLKDEEMYSRRAVAAHPEFLMARLYLADALINQNRLDEAAEVNRQVLAIDPGNCDALNNLGTIYDKQGQKQEALREFRLSLASKPDQSVAHSKIGRVLMEMHQVPEAAEEFAQALRYDPENGSMHNDLGVALFQMGDFAKAAEQFGDAARIDPSSIASKNLEVAQAQMKNKKVDQAGK